MKIENNAPGSSLRLYHAPSSYYSMIARLALAEAGVFYERVFVDIHYRMSQQKPDYVRLNPDMTVPTLVGSGVILDQSRDICEYALDQRDDSLDTETRGWLDLHYGYPIEELTFGGLLSRNPFARTLIPKRLASVGRRLLASAAANPDLASAYEARAAVFAERARAFDPATIRALAIRRRSEAIGLMDRLESGLSDGRDVIVPPRYGVADVVWTVFLARMEFAALGGEIQKRSRLARYWHDKQARPSFAAADIWTHLHVGRLIGGIVGLVR